jgi:hypothetical protein
MYPEKNEEAENKFGKVIDILHSKQKLPSLRTYQGDMAQFIKDKNESVLTVTLKEKKRREDREDQAKIKTETQKEGQTETQTGAVSQEVVVAKPKNLRTNIIIIILSFLLLGLGVLASFYIFNFLKKEPVSEVVIKQEIIPYNNLAPLSNVSAGDIGKRLASVVLPNGINIVEISDVNGLSLQKSGDFFTFLKISPPSALKRILKDDYVLGAISKDGKNKPFIVLTVNDFGGAFSAMLDWEKKMGEDLAFLSFKEEKNIVAIETPVATTTPVINISTTTVATNATTTKIASSTATTTKLVKTVEMPKTPEKTETFTWKDVIIKNKDTRGLVNENGQTKIAYTFLDKSTILIVGDIDAIGEISSAYVSRAVAR